MFKKTKLLEEQNRLKAEEIAVKKQQAEAQEKANRISQQAMSIMLEQEQAKQAKQVRFAPPVIPAGVIPKGEKSILGMDSCGEIYNYANSSDVSFFAAFEGYPVLAHMSQSSDYRSVPETLANEMTRAWGEMYIKGEDDLTKEESQNIHDKIAIIAEKLEKFNVRNLLREALVLEGIMGRSHLAIKIKNADDTLPLIISNKHIKKGELEGFALVDPTFTTPSAYNASYPLRKDFYVPSAWFVMGEQINADRLITFITRPVPYLLRPAYNFGGLSMLQLMKPYVQRYQRAADSISEMLHSYSMTILKTDMSNILAGGEGNSSLYLRTGMLGMFKDNNHTVLIDQMAEDIVQINTPLNGLSDLLSMAQEQMSAPSHIPKIVLTGITPSGMNASSESEIRVWYDYVKSQQEAFLSVPLMDIIKLIQLDEFGDIDESINWRWNSLFQMTEKEIAEVKMHKSTEARNYIECDVLAPKEVRQALSSDADGSYSSINVDEVPEPLHQDYDMSFSNEVE